MTDTQRMAWLIANVKYLEDNYTQPTEAGGYWPQNLDDSHPDPDMIGLNLVDYIDSMLYIESQKEQAEYHRQAADRIDDLINNRLYREVE